MHVKKLDVNEDPDKAFSSSAALMPSFLPQIQPAEGGITLEIPVEDAAVTNSSICQALVSNLQVHITLLAHALISNFQAISHSTHFMTQVC